MQKQISTVQKVMIVALSLILIAAMFIQYGLIPSMDRMAYAIRVNDRARAAQREMDSLVTRIERTKNEADDGKAKIEEYKSHLMVYEAVEDIATDFTNTLLDKNLNPLAVKVTPEATSADNPFKKFSITINASGTLQGFISMCGYINKENSYMLTDLKISEEQNSYRATMVVSAVYVKEGESPQDEK